MRLETMLQKWLLRKCKYAIGLNTQKFLDPLEKRNPVTFVLVNFIPNQTTSAIVLVWNIKGIWSSSPTSCHWSSPTAKCIIIQSSQHSFSMNHSVHYSSKPIESLHLAMNTKQARRRTTDHYSSRTALCLFMHHSTLKCGIRKASGPAPMTHNGPFFVLHNLLDDQ